MSFSNSNQARAFMRKKNQNLCISVKSTNDIAASKDVLAKLIDNGANMVRYNLVEEDLDWNRNNINAIRRIALERNKKLSIIMDLHGNLPLLGSFINGSVLLKNNDVFILDTNPAPGNLNRVFLNSKDLFYKLLPGMRLIIGDGNVELMVTETNASQISTLVLKEGLLTDYKVVNPVNFLATSCKKFTQLDLIGIQLVKEMNLEALAYPAIETQDLLEIKKLLQDNSATAILAKIASDAALKSIEELVKTVDGFILIRETLAHSLGYKLIRKAQNYVLDTARKNGKLCMIMLSHFYYEQTQTPQIAVIIDILNAVSSGSSGFILPGHIQALLPSIQLLNNILEQVDSDYPFKTSKEDNLIKKLVKFIKIMDIQLLLINGADDSFIRSLAKSTDATLLVSGESSNFTLYPNIHVIAESFTSQNKMLYEFCLQNNLINEKESIAILDFDQENLIYKVLIPNLYHL